MFNTLASLGHPWIPVHIIYIYMVNVYNSVVNYLSKIISLVLALASIYNTCVYVYHLYNYAWTGLSALVKVSMHGCYSYSGIPGPSMVTSINWSIPPCQSIHGCHSYSGIPRLSMVRYILVHPPLSEFLDYPWLLVYTGLPLLSEYLCMPIRIYPFQSSLPLNLQTKILFLIFPALVRALFGQRSPARYANEQFKF